MTGGGKLKLDDRHVYVVARWICIGVIDLDFEPVVAVFRKRLHRSPAASGDVDRNTGHRKLPIIGAFSREYGGDAGFCQKRHQRNGLRFRRKRIVARAVFIEWRRIGHDEAQRGFTRAIDACRTDSAIFVARAHARAVRVVGHPTRLIAPAYLRRNRHADAVFGSDARFAPLRIGHDAIRLFADTRSARYGVACGV